MSRTLEVIFRHPLQLFLLLLIPIAAGVAFAYTLPRSYTSSASLWALRRYEIIGASGPESDLSSTPAETQVSALQELIQGRTFDLTIAKSSNLASTLNVSSAPNEQAMDDAMIQEIAKHVIITATGYNVYTISYTSHDPHVAYQVIANVIKQFQNQGQSFSITEGQQLLQGYQTQLVQARKDADSAANAESQYAAHHPEITASGANPLSNPQYALLDAKRLQLQSILQNLQSTIATINQEIATQNTGAGSFFNTLDTPQVPTAATSRSKNFEVAGGAGAAIGLLVYILYIVILVRRDRAIYTSRDLQKISGYPVLMQLPQLSLVTMRNVLANEEE